MDAIVVDGQIIFEPWDPKYIILHQMKRAKDIVTAENWNNLFNRLIAQGDWNAEALDKLINQGVIKVKNAEHADDSDMLGGHEPDYFAYRHNVIGLDEEVYKPGTPYKPVDERHPANKWYVDDVAKNISDYTDEFDNIVYWDSADYGPEGPITIDQALKDGIGEVIHNKYVTKRDIEDVRQSIIDELMPQGGGDMVKGQYDSNENGIVDDSERLGGIEAKEYTRYYYRDVGARTPISEIEFYVTE